MSLWCLYRRRKQSTLYYRKVNPAYFISTECAQKLPSDLRPYRKSDRDVVMTSQENGGEIGIAARQSVLASSLSASRPDYL